MVKTQVSRCDTPGCGQQGARSYEVRFPTGVLTADLCDEHAQPLEQLRGTLPKALFVKHGQRKKAMRVVVDPNAV
jgi:hypothetical protein